MWTVNDGDSNGVCGGPESRFPASAMLEFGSGLHRSRDIMAGIGDRMWKVLKVWYSQLVRGPMTITYLDPSAVSAHSICTLGEAPMESANADCENLH